MAPPVMAQHVEGRGWVLEMEFSPHASLGMGHVDLNVRCPASCLSLGTHVWTGELSEPDAAVAAVRAFLWREPCRRHWGCLNL